MREALAVQVRVEAKGKSLKAEGSGFFIAPGLVVTCFHVLVPREHHDEERHRWSEHARQVESIRIRRLPEQTELLTIMQKPLSIEWGPREGINARLSLVGSSPEDDVALLVLECTPSPEPKPLRLTAFLKWKEEYDAFGCFPSQGAFSGQVRASPHPNKPRDIVLLSVLNQPALCAQHTPRMSGTPFFVGGWEFIAGIICSVDHGNDGLACGAVGAPVAAIWGCYGRFKSAAASWSSRLEAPKPVRPICTEDLQKLRPNLAAQEAQEGARDLAEALCRIHAAGIRKISVVSITEEAYGSSLVLRLQGPAGSFDHPMCVPLAKDLVQSIVDLLQVRMNQQPPWPSLDFRPEVDLS